MNKPLLNKSDNSSSSDKYDNNKRELNKKKASRWLYFGNLLFAMADGCFAFSYKYPDMVVNAFLNSFYNGFAFFGNACQIRAMKFDPDLAESGLIKKRPLNKAMAVVGATGLITCSAWVGLALTFSPLAPVVGLIGASMVTVQSIVNSAGAIKDFISEIGNKSPKETYKLRLLNKGTQALSSLCSVAFNACWVAAAALVMVTPVGWAAAGGALFVTGLAFLGISIVTSVTKYFSEKKCKAIETNLKNNKPNLRNTKKPEYTLTHHKSLDRNANYKKALFAALHKKTQLRNSAESLEAHPESPGVLFQMKTKRHEAGKSLLKNIFREKEVLHPIQNLSQNPSLTLEEANQLFNQRTSNKNPLYNEAIEVKEDGTQGKMKDGFALKIPRTATLASPHSTHHPSAKTKNDMIWANLNDNKQVEVWANRGHGDSVIYIIFDLFPNCKKFENEPCNNAKLALKYLSASKFRGVEMVLNNQDLELINQNPNFKSYYQLIKNMSPKEFQAKVDELEKEQGKKLSLGELPAAFLKPSKPPAPKP